MSRLGLAGLAGLLSLAAAPADTTLLFQAEAQTLAGTCTGNAMRVEGNHNVITVTGECASLLLKGVGNTVRLTIAAAGAIGWRAAPTASPSPRPVPHRRSRCSARMTR